MDDLSGLDWSSSSASAKPTSAKPTLAAQSAAFASPAFGPFASLRPTPPPGQGSAAGSGRSTPLSAQGSGALATRPAAPKPAGMTPAAQDSFSGLFNSGAGKSTANMSLREQQQRLEAERRRKEEERRRQQEANYGNGQFFDILGAGRGGSTPSPLNGVRSGGSGSGSGGGGSSGGGGGGSGDDDLFAAFNADTKVDQASHFPPTSSRTSTPTNAPLDLSNPRAWDKPRAATAAAAATAKTNTCMDNDEDDPFGLNQLNANTKAAAPPLAATAGDDDDVDFLGDLGKPVEEVRRKTEVQRQQQQQQQQQQQRPQRQQQPEPGKPIEGSDSDSDASPQATSNRRPHAASSNPKLDHAVAQLVDYGFSPEDARRGLEQSGRGLNVQAAVNWLLDDAHRQAKEKSRAKQGKQGDSGAGGGGGGGPAWMRDSDALGAASGRGDTRPPATGMPGDDFAKTAAAISTNLFKTANSLWKTGQKQLQKAVQDFQQEGDPSQPKWMRSAGADHLDGAGDGADMRQRQRAAPATSSSAAATDEALMLEAGGRPDRRQPGGSGRGGRGTPPDAARFRPDSQASSRTQSPAGGAGFGSGPPSRNNPVPRWQQGRGGGMADPKARLTKQAIEAESAQVYVSPARRRKAPTPAPAAAPEPSNGAAVLEGDLLSNSTALPQRPAPRTERPTARATQRATPSPRPAAVARPVPSVNAFVLKASAKHRADGAAHFKRGDYAAAHASYSASLTDIPAAHPLLAVLFCNRALTALKTGEPRQAVADADAALAIIGPGKGAGETVGLEDGTGATRDLRDLYGKAMTRKAEALEQMEKWAEAEQVWRQCVEGGVGGATAIAGRQRCQKATAPRPSAPTPRATPRPTPRPGAAASGSGSGTPTSASGRDFEAVQRLREAHAAAAREDAEKLGLLDQVDARVAAWRDGKKDNLRALLGSLERVLWDSSGWKPVGLHELVLPNRVKVVYMKAIAKTHPDKLPADAPTEVRMIAGTVFATLNESWDKFKADNKM